MLVNVLIPELFITYISQYRNVLYNVYIYTVSYANIRFPQ